MHRVFPIASTKENNEDDNRSEASSSLNSVTDLLMQNKNVKLEKNSLTEDEKNRNFQNQILKEVMSQVLPDDGEYDVDGMMASKANTSNSFFTSFLKILGILDLDLHEAVIAGSFKHAQRAVRNIMSGKTSNPLLINQLDEKGRTPLSIATKIKNKQIVDILLDNKALPDIADEASGRTPLMYSILNRTIEISKSLLMAGASVNFADFQSVTPLMLIASINDIEHCKLLCTKSVDTDTQDYNGWTALHYCACYNSLEVMNYLIVKEGADSSIRDMNKRKPVDIAKFKNHGECVASLSTNARRLA